MTDTSNTTIRSMEKLLKQKWGNLTGREKDDLSKVFFALSAERDAARDALRRIAETKAHYAGQTVNEYHFQQIASAALRTPDATPKEAKTDG